MKTRSGEKMKLASIEELLGVVNEESAMEIDINKIHSFKEHPFKVLDDERMKDLVDSVKINGILTPVLVRTSGRDSYEMISGHRRLHAAILSGLETIPAIVRELSDDEAVISMVDANIQREELLPSEKAFAYKMKLDAMKRQGKRSDLTSSQNETKLRSDELLSRQSGESRAQIQRYIRLTELITELLDMVDAKKLNFTTAVEISYLDKEIQKWVYEYIWEKGSIKPKQIALLRKHLENETIDQEQMNILFESCMKKKTSDEKIVLAGNKFRHYFPESYTQSDIEKVIEQLLEKWKEESKMNDMLEHLMKEV